MEFIFEEDLTQLESENLIMSMYQEDNRTSTQQLHSFWKYCYEPKKNFDHLNQFEQSPVSSEQELEEFLIEAPLVHETWFIERSLDQVIIGMLVLDNDSFDDLPMIDLYIGLPYTRKGYASEAIELYFEYLKEHEIDTVYTSVLKENTPAIQFLTSLGYTKVNQVPEDLDDPSIDLYKRLL